MPSAFTGALGETVTIRPIGSLSRDIRAIFKRPSEVDFGDTGIVAMTPYIRARTVDVEDMQPGDLVTVNGVEYRAEAPEPDHRGMTHIPLSMK